MFISDINVKFFCLVTFIKVYLLHAFKNHVIFVEFCNFSFNKNVDVLSKLTEQKTTHDVDFKICR